MNQDKKNAIDKLDEQQLRNQISTTMCCHNKDKAEIVAYCESRLESLNVESALVPEPDLTGFGEQ